MALLGKISAVLTANTQDFTRRIGESRRELQDFARQARGIQFNLNTRALDGTLTQLQRFQRTLREIQQLQARGVDAGLPNVGRLRDQFRAFEDIGRPLTNVKNQIEGLSSAIQSELYPELQKIQAGFRNFYRDLDTGAATFDRSAKRIENLQQRLLALSRATAVAKDIGGLSRQLEASSSGASFFSPSAKEALKKTIALRGDAENIPARFRGGQFADLAVAAEENAARVEKAVARVARAQLRTGRPRGETARNLEFRGRAQQELDAAVREQAAINALFDREIRSATIKQIVSPDAVSQVEQLTEKFGKLSARLREGGDQRFDGLIASVGRVVERLNQGEISAKKAKLAIEALAGAEATKSFSAAGFGKADALIRTDSERAIEQIRRDAQKQRNNIIGDNPTLGRRRRASIEGVNLREDIALSREEFNRTAAGRVNDLSSRVKDIKDAGLTSQFDNIRKLAGDANVSLKAAFDGRNTAAGARALDNYKAKFPALVAEIDKFESKLKSAETARKRFDQFLTISGSRSDKLGADLNRAATDITVARQFAGNYDADNIGGRQRVAAEIEKSISVYKKAAEVQQRIFDREFKNEEARARAIARTTKVIEGQRKALKDTVVDESGGRVSGSRFDAASRRAARNAGSIGVGGIAAAQLALQQGLFAIDDLASASGGLEYKLRAVGNNITQLGLLLGQSGLIPGLSATTGLFIGLGAVLGGQLASAVLRFAYDSKTVEERLKSLNSAAESQQSSVRRLAEEYAKLGDELRRIGQSEIGQQNSSVERQVRELADARGAEFAERIAATDPDVANIRARRGVLQNRLETETGIPERVRIQRDIERTRTEEQRVLSRLSSEANGQSIADNVRASSAGALAQAESAVRLAESAPAGTDESRIRGAKESLERIRQAVAGLADFPAFDVGDTRKAGEALVAIRGQIEAIQDLRGSVGVQGAAGIESALDDIVSRLLKDAARIEARLSGAFDQVDAALTRGATAAARSLGRGGRLLQEAFDGSVSSSAIQAEIDRIADVLAQVRESAGAAATPEDAAAFEQDIAAINQHANALTGAALVVKSFSDAFAQAQQSVSSDVASLRQRADEARRADIALSTPETRSARSRAEQDASDAGRLQRQANDELASARERVEQDLLRDGTDIGRRRAEIDRQLAVPANEFGQDGVSGGTVEERDRLRAERRAIDDQINAAVESSPEVAAARQRRDEITRELANAQAADRGRVLAQTPGQRALEEFSRGAEDIRQYFGRLAEDGNGLVDIEGQNAAVRRFAGEQMRAAAPGIFSMADAVQTAILQGPSRAALRATDASTVEGQAELNRLLRGDDSSRDQNLAELQRQNQTLKEVATGIKDMAEKMGIVLDL